MTLIEQQLHQLIARMRKQKLDEFVHPKNMMLDIEKLQECASKHYHEVRLNNNIDYEMDDDCIDDLLCNYIDTAVDYSYCNDEHLIDIATFMIGKLHSFNFPLLLGFKTRIFFDYKADFYFEFLFQDYQSASHLAQVIYSQFFHEVFSEEAIWCNNSIFSYSWLTSENRGLLKTL